MMRIWKRALAIVLALALVVPTPAFADEVVEDYVVPEALTPELDDELYGVDSFAEDDDFMVEPDDGFGADGKQVDLLKTWTRTRGMLTCRMR